MVTRRPARAIGMSGELGEISVGAYADLIAVPYSGAVDQVFDGLIDNRSPISWMMVGGRPLKNVVAEIKTQPQRRSLGRSGQQFLASHFKTVG